MDAAHDGDWQRLDAVEHAEHGPDARFDVLRRFDLLKLAHVSADDEALVLAGHDNEPGDLLGSRAGFNPLDDGSQFLERPAAQ